MSLGLCKYSEAERKLIGKISPHWLDVIDKTCIYPSSLYKELLTIVFVENQNGPHVEALRRVMTAFEECKIDRMTPEFDKLCDF